jgi:hypothetical protein
MIDLDRNESSIDIHHIFPKAWCVEHDISPRTFNSIVNKTPISAKANRMIGGKAPSKYLAQIQSDPKVEITVERQDAILRSHLIDPALLRADDFEAFFASRKEALLRLVADAMGKPIVLGGEAPADDPIEDDVINEGSVDFAEVA